MPNVFPDDILARIRALKSELDALTLVVDTGGGSSSPLTTKGDVWGYDSADNRVPVGADGEVLTADSGDALGVSWQAGGGGASPLTTKGDLFTYSTVDDRLGIGANATILQADSAQTTGNRWAALSGDATVATGGALTLATVNSNTGALGDSVNALTVTTNGKGLVTAVATTAQEVYASQSQASAATISYTTARVHRLTLTGTPVTLTLSGATNAVACGVTMYIVQDGTGTRLITWPGSVKWPGGVAPTLSTAANAVDIVVLESTDGGTTWYGNYAGKGYA